MEQNQKFTDANSEIYLPNNLDVDLPLDKFLPLNGVNPPKDTAFNAENPEESNSESWSQVVSRKKGESNIGKCNNDRRILEH